MVEYLSKEAEKRMLIERIFPVPYAGSSELSLLLLRVCKELGSSYSLQFDERGYTKEYASFDKDKILDETSRLITDEALYEQARINRDALSNYHTFKGKYYTYEPKKMELTLGRSWERIRKDILALIRETAECVKCVLEAVVEVSKTPLYDSYWPIFTTAKRKGLERAGGRSCPSCNSTG